MIPNQVRICSGFLAPLSLLRWEGVGNEKYGWGKGDMVGMGAWMESGEYGWE